MAMEMAFQGIAWLWGWREATDYSGGQVPESHAFQQNGKFCLHFQ